jgi:hypothetical protein
MKHRLTRASLTPGPGALRPSPTPCITGFRLAKASLRPPLTATGRLPCSSRQADRFCAQPPTDTVSAQLRHFYVPFSLSYLPASCAARLALRVACAHARTFGSFCVALVIGDRVRCRATGGVACYFPDERALREQWVSGRGLETAGREGVALGWDR